MLKNLLFVLARRKVFDKEVICLDQRRLEKGSKNFESF